MFNGHRTTEHEENVFRIVNLLVKKNRKTVQKTSDSLNEGLPIKMARNKFQRKRYFFHQKDNSFNSRNVRKSVFLIGQVPL